MDDYESDVNTAISTSVAFDKNKTAEEEPVEADSVSSAKTAIEPPSWWEPTSEASISAINGLTSSVNTARGFSDVESLRSSSDSDFSTSEISSEYIGSESEFSATRSLSSTTASSTELSTDDESSSRDYTTTTEDVSSTVEMDSAGPL
uniref:Dentin sialophosphoprotein-like n=1 Tax=Panagrellus redivivus TaxID=6233 RepID=A0A7E4UW68_PANRE